ncbi:MAG TPA: rRNA maturation RNase YbeY [Acidobacteriaceae bacterium]|jgi:probable rRNA maturation factor|nr:rRNA maturation RNase YbeY [Acidobacteriaceae bacterium]
MILIEPTIQARFGRALRQRALAAFLRQAAEAAGLAGQVSVLLTGDSHIRRLNREFRRKDHPTDVLSFPAAEPGPRAIAGDLAISVDTAARQATEFGHPLATELQILVLHGVLHLGGYDHEADGGQMARKEARLRRQFGLAAGLIERTEKPAARKRASARGRGRR